MPDSSDPQQSPPGHDEGRAAAASPSAAVLPGVVLVFIGLWMVTDGGPVPLGWAAFATGLALLLVGSVAWGVSWGLELHQQHRRPR